MEITSNTETGLVQKKELDSSNNVRSTLIPENTSIRITSLRFLLSILVVFIHNNYTAEIINSLLVPPAFSPNAFTVLLQFIISEGLGKSPVPLFFIFAAYLQAKKGDSYKVLVKKRIRSLVVPFVVWTAIYLFCQFSYTYLAKVVLLKLIPSLQLNPDKTMFTWGIKDWIIQLIGYGPCLSPGLPYNVPLIASQFWFVRDLIILVLISPILVSLIKKFPIGTFLFLNIIHFSGMQIYFVVDYALYFYSIGLFWGIYDLDLFETVDKISWPVTIILFILTFVGEKYFPIETQELMSKFKVILSCVFFLKLSALIVKNEKIFSISKYLAPFSFFLYAIHMPVLLTFVQRLWLKVLPMKNPFFCLLEYFGATILIILIGTGLGIALKKIFPKLFAILTGGR